MAVRRIHDEVTSRSPKPSIVRPEPELPSEPPVTRPTLWDTLKTFSLRSFIFAVALGILAAAGGAAVAMKRPAVYSANAQLLINQAKLVADSKDQGPLLKLSVLRLKYAGLATTPAIAGPAADSLGLPESQVAAAVTATATPNSLLLVVTSQSSTSSDARRIANAVGQSIIKYVSDEQQGIGVAPSDQYTFALVQPAVSAAKVQPTVSRSLQAAVGLGALALVLVYVIMQLISGGLRSR
jgi:capsular polysaccharide biosynthesis protein